MAITKQVIVVRKDLNMDAGKLGSQVAHAAMAFLTKTENRCLIDRIDVDGPPEAWLRLQLSSAVRDWLDHSYTKIVLECRSEQELLDLIETAKVDGIEVNPITDNGTTVFGGIPTLTCAAFGPDYAERLDKHLSHLKLYKQNPVYNTIKETTKLLDVPQPQPIKYERFM